MYFELRITVLVKQTKHHLEIQEHIGNWISRAQLGDPYFKQTHYDKGFKHYVFSSLYPLEKDGIYQRGRAYILTVRSSRQDIVSRINACMRSSREDDYFQFVSIDQRTRKHSHITEMITITPAIVTIDHKPWVNEKNIEVLVTQLHANAEKKYINLYPNDPMKASQSFIQGIRVENRKPIATTYKGRKLLGNKLRLFINEDDYSQKLANIVLGSGLAEKGSSLGAGFCLAKCIE